MMLRLVLISSAISMALVASDNASRLSPFPDAGKTLPQLARESVDRQIAASVQGCPRITGFRGDGCQRIKRG